MTNVGNIAKRWLRKDIKEEHKKAGFSSITAVNWFCLIGLMSGGKLKPGEGERRCVFFRGVWERKVLE